jgi:hypothetical protein
MCFSSPSDDEVGGIRSAIRSERGKQSNTEASQRPTTPRSIAGRSGWV